MHGAFRGRATSDNIYVHDSSKASSFGQLMGLVV
jgi:hypothetical protein